MEFTLTISQKQIHENFPTLDIKDAAIIDFLSRFSHSCDRKIFGKEIYYWFDYGKICSECPLLKLDPESIRRRVRMLCKLNILAAHPENRGGKVFFAFGKNYSLTHRDRTEKGRAENPEVQKRSGRKSRPQRAENPELLAKGRADLPDNHNNQLDHNNQSSTYQENAADAADAELLVRSTTEFPGVTLVEKFNLEAEKKESPKVPLKGYLPARPAPGESDPLRWDAFDIDKAAEEIKANPFSAENFARITGTPPDQMNAKFTAEVDVFVLEQKGKQTKYNRFDEFSSHFFNYERAKVRSGRNGCGTQQKPNYTASTIPLSLQNKIGR